MKIVIASDSFKESMSAKEACQAIERGILSYDSTIETLLCPMSDGGEGTLESLIDAMHGYKQYYKVTGPLFGEIEAPIGYVKDIAIIECAKVCGLELLSEEKKDPYYTTTYGLGELMLHAINHGAKKLLICLGGSATNDGGIGMLSALGMKFLSHKLPVTLTMAGLKEIDDICFDGLDQRIKDVEIVAVCDVKNPLCGTQGATYIYGPQKGLKSSDLHDIDNAMKKYAQKIDEYLKSSYALSQGAGAAGGLGFALLSCCAAQFQSGFDVVARMQNIESLIETSDLVVVGEGKIDKQTQFGKTPYGVFKLAQKYHKPVFAFAGRVEDEDILKKLGFIHVYEISPRDLLLERVLQQGQEYLEKCVHLHMEEMSHEL